MRNNTFRSLPDLGVTHRDSHSEKDGLSVAGGIEGRQKEVGSDATFARILCRFLMD